VLQSEPGDYIGGGQTTQLTTDEVDFQTSVYYDGGVSFFINNFQRPYQYPIFWSLFFGGPNGQLPTVGEYEGATRYPFSYPNPGLSVGGNGAGCNIVSGRFTVYEIVVDQETSELKRFAADFEQHCEGSEPALLGAIRYNSDVPIAIKAPPKIKMVSPLNYRGCVEATSAASTSIKLSALASGDGNYQFSWASSSGLVGTGKNFEVSAALNQAVVVTLNELDLASNETRSVTRTVCAADTTPPVVKIVSPSDGSMIVSRAFQLVVEVTDTVDKNLKQFESTMGRFDYVQLSGATGRVLIPNPNAADSSQSSYIQVIARDSSGNAGYAYSFVRFARDASTGK
jgi:hypothetical protein